MQVEPLRQLPAPRSIDQSIPPEVAAACAGMAESVWSCVRRTMEPTVPGRGGPRIVVAPSETMVRLTVSRQVRRDGKPAKTIVPARRLLLVVDRMPPEVGEATIWC